MKLSSHARRYQPWPEHDSAAQAHYAANYEVNVFAPLPPPVRVAWQRNRQLAQFQVVSSGYYGRAHGLQWERSGLDETVLIYCVAGTGSYWQAGHTWSIHAGDVVYCAPLTHHRYSADARDPWSVYWLHLKGPQVPRFIRPLGVSRQAPIIHVGLRPEMTALFDELFSLRRVDYRFEELQAMQTCVQHLLARLALAQRFELADRAHASGLNKIIEEMRAGLPGGFSLPAIAARFGSSSGHFLRLFRRQTGETPARFYSRQQIRRACALLADSPLRIKEVSAQVGFKDQYHFSRVFRHITGMPPRAWRGAIAGDRK